ncbi:hypothetical protein EV195_10480 [Tenacibaculum skagerrakense]|uniref:Uncharacterized protein n=1 Tax=Tenacibaculum skagerrakense TaxID=186571 RepID=A0A4R2NSU6_9FLAO|nr:hypothetical protein [Tenacibaculum skagerrakense]TCP25049.1 hypothetical protein EV195_10480 [Tenacibaculum skagerrakense]
MKTYYKILFVIGLLFEAIGQILLSRGNEFVYALKPIDFAHWSLLLGVVLLIPQVGNFPRSMATYLGVPTILIGITCIIGMCVLDFIWWSQPNQEIRNEFAGHLYNVKAIWNPFIAVGPNFLNVGLFLLALNYIKTTKTGVILIVLATLTVFFGSFIPSRLIYVYLITAIGYGLIFFNNKTTNEY